jgi:hypothetical protein
MKEIDLLAKWKAIPLGSFHYVLPRGVSKTYSYRLADKLVLAGVAHKVKCVRSRMSVLVPSKKALEYSFQNFNMSEFSNYCQGSFIASALLDLSVFENKKVRFLHEEHEIDTSSDKLLADFTIYGLGPESTLYHIGVFFEPPHHSKGNSQQKMMRYVAKGDFDVIILIFKSLDDLNKRRELYFENREHKHGKELKRYICLVHVEEYLNSPDEINKSYVYFQGEETTLNGLFK